MLAMVLGLVFIPSFCLTYRIFRWVEKNYPEYIYEEVEEQEEEE